MLALNTGPQRKCNQLQNPTPPDPIDTGSDEINHKRLQSYAYSHTAVYAAKTSGPTGKKTKAAHGPVLSIVHPGLYSITTWIDGRQQHNFHGFQGFKKKGIRDKGIFCYSYSVAFSQHDAFFCVFTRLEKGNHAARYR